MVSRPSAEPPARDRILAVLNGAFLMAGFELLGVSVALVLLARRLGASEVVVGLLVSFRFAGWLFPQLLAAGWMQGRRLYRPFYLAADGGRVIATALMALAVALWATDRPRWALFGLLAFFLLSRVCAGVGALARLSIVGKLFPPRSRPAFFAQRSFWGRLLGLGASALMGYLLAEPVPYPWNYVLLIGLASLLFAVGWAAFAAVREPPGRDEAPAPGPGAALRSGGRILREDPAFRLYVVARSLAIFSSAAPPFYTLYAREDLGIPTAWIGAYVPVAAVAGILANLAWGWLGRARGNRTLFRAALAVSWLPPLLALLLPRTVAGGLLLWLFGLVFLFQQVGLAGRQIGSLSYAYDLIPPAQRPLYLGLMNTVGGISALGPWFGGWVVARFGAPALFLVALGAQVLAWILLGRLPEGREEGRERP